MCSYLRYRKSGLVVLTFLVAIILLCVHKNGVESALPFGIFPILPSEWYYKPTPGENVVFGLILIKVLALRLASIFGILPIPYHLNDLFAFALRRSLGKRSIPENITWRNLTSPPLPFSSNTVSISAKGRSRAHTTEPDLKDAVSMLRILSGIRQTDTQKCVFKTLCIATRDRNLKSYMTSRIAKMIQYLTLVEEWLITKKYPIQPQFHLPVMDVYIHSLNTGKRNSIGSTSPCATEYPMCSLKEDNLLRYFSVIMPPY